MEIVQSEQIYCSVDLEFTGFDPSKDQILEIGFAFFKVSEHGLEVTEQWTQVFRPSIDVHPKILGLTGITQEELDAAPDFNEHREFLQSKLGNAIIVGHNPVMDVKFLESYGLKLSGKIIDTLELVQFILPTHHSYNLENLVHYFGVNHHAAHRALGDALSTVAVLENLLRIYQNFTIALQTELQSVIIRNEFLWNDLLQHNFGTKDIEANDSLENLMSLTTLQPLQLSSKLITIDTEVTNHETRVALGLQKTGSTVVLAVPSAATVMQLWKDGLVHGVFTPHDTFSPFAFQAFLNRATSTDELRFCLKIIVWLHTNWQTEVVLDLNISFFGGQFRSFITGGQPVTAADKVLCVDYSTLQTVPMRQKNLVICDIQSFEKYISGGFGNRVSWNSTLYALKLLYNPETQFGNSQIKDTIISALAATDLFFGLVYMLLHATYPHNEYATIQDLYSNHTITHSKLYKAAVNLQKKLQAIPAEHHTSEISRIEEFLVTFFEPSMERVKWVYIDERNVAFHDQPISISESIHKLLSTYTTYKFTDTIGNYRVLSYVTDRLGLDTETSEFAEQMQPTTISIDIHEEFLSDHALFELSSNAALPLVIVLPNLNAVKDFYNQHYIEIKKGAALFAQGYSGGGNKMFRNFSINENSVLVLTADFMAKQNYAISAKTIIFAEMPSIDAQHPYTAALLNHWQHRYADLESVLSTAKFFSVLKKINFSTKTKVIIYNCALKNIFVDKNIDNMKKL